MHADPAGNLASYIDHTLLKADATETEIEQLCEEARRLHFASVCVNTSFVSLCARALDGSGVNVCAVVGFPLGAASTQAKRSEAERALADGAREIDMVMHIGMLKGGKADYVLDDIRSIVEAAQAHGARTKVILETSLLSDLQKVEASRLAQRAGADFVKTSTGFGKGGATTDDVALMRKTVGPSMGVKASGGIRTREQALAMIAAGATRIGTSSGVSIVEGENR